MFNITGVIGGDFDNTLYYCYLMENSVETYTLQRWSTFVDINDFYTSFLFNLLAQSLQIRAYSLSLTTYQNNADWPNFVLYMARLARICLDFQSSNSGSLQAKPSSLSASAYLKQYLKEE
jgi:hypothetical protein